MAATTLRPGLADIQTASSGQSFLSRAFAGFIEAREAEARRRVALYMDMYSDVELKERGLNSEDIKRLRNV